MNMEAGTRARGATGNTRTGEGSSANLFDGLTDQAKPASEGDVRTPILIPRERTARVQQISSGNGVRVRVADICARRSCR